MVPVLGATPKAAPLAGVARVATPVQDSSRVGALGSTLPARVGAAAVPAAETSAFAAGVATGGFATPPTRVRRLGELAVSRERDLRHTVEVLRETQVSEEMRLRSASPIYDMVEPVLDGEARASSSLSPRSGSRSGAGERVLQWNTAVPKRLKIASSKSFKVGSASALSTPGGVGTLVDEDSRPSPRAVSGPFGSVRDVRARTGLAEEDLDSSECSLSSGSCCCDFEMKEPHGTSVATVGRNSAFGVAENARIYEDQDAQLRDLDDRMKATESALRTVEEQLAAAEELSSTYSEYEKNRERLSRIEERGPRPAAPLPSRRIGTRTMTMEWSCKCCYSGSTSDRFCWRSCYTQSS